MPVNTFRAFEAQFNVRLLEAYGLTEGTCICATNPPDGERRVGSVGFRLPYQQMRVVQLDDAGYYVRDATPDEVGIVSISGPQVFQGYKQDQHNQGIWLDIAGERWLNTGDMGRQDENGYFWLVGRKKDLIIRGGHNIDPAMIEDILINHPSVAFAAAVGRPEARLGEIPTAYVELKPGQSTTEQDLLAYLGMHIGERAACPRRIKIIEHMPMTMIGKIYKPELRGLEASEVYQDEVKSLGDIEHVTTHAVHTSQGILIAIIITAAPGTDPHDLTERIARSLGRYIIPYDLTIV
jgi:fatty-acyl-CoA synthase